MRRIVVCDRPISRPSTRSTNGLHPLCGFQRSLDNLRNLFVRDRPWATCAIRVRKAFDAVLGKQRLLGGPAWLQEGPQIAAVAQLRDVQSDGARKGTREVEPPERVPQTKSFKTENGAFEIEMPHDRKKGFEPKLICKG